MQVIVLCSKNSVKMEKINELNTKLKVGLKINTEKRNMLLLTRLR